LTSPDAITWTTELSGQINNFIGIHWNGSLFVAVGGGIIFTSPDGSNWTKIYSPTTSFIMDVAWDGSKFILVGIYSTVLVSP